MTVDITVLSVIDELDDNGLTCDSSKTEISCPAVLTADGGVTTLLYKTEENGQSTDTEITISDGSVRVIRRGAIESDFIFEENKSVRSLYKIPPYAFDAEIYTKKIRKSEKDGISEITIIYDMTVGEAKKSVRMKISYPGGSI